MLINCEIAQCLEETHTSINSDYVEVVKGTSLPLSTGGAFYAGNNDFFSQVIGWGFSASAKELDKIEQFYKEQKSNNVAFKFSTLAKLETLNMLIDIGYHFSEFNNVSLLKTFPSSIVHDKVGNEIQIAICKTPDEITLWAKTVAQGFGLESHNNFFFNYDSMPEVTIFLAKKAIPSLLLELLQ